ncbi:uncharacterized protein V6R79_011533 [Siganus canaliculatus]
MRRSSRNSNQLVRRNQDFVVFEIQFSSVNVDHQEDIVQKSQTLICLVRSLCIRALMRSDGDDEEDDDDGALNGIVLYHEISRL